LACLLGIDNGLTVTKSVVFDISGEMLAVSRKRVPQVIPEPRHVERDMAGLWRATAGTIREALAASGRPASDIIAVAATAHGDGVYLLGRAGEPLGPGILSLDSRAADVVTAWQAGGVFPEALRLSGQHPHVSAPSALLAWIRDHQPERFQRIGHVLACKDWLRYCLCGEIGTDRTEASTSFTEFHSQHYHPEILELFGLGALRTALPHISHSARIVGRVIERAARETGLLAGTPVAAGLHDVTASALGIGAHVEGIVGVVAGTYSINETLSTVPRADSRWLCRNGVEAGKWNNMSISPASATNYDWFIDTLCRAEGDQAERDGMSIHARLQPEIERGLAAPSTLLYQPYLFGSPHGAGASASFIGLHGWHDRADMLAAVLEGIAFNHRTHVDALRDGFAVGSARLTGGISRVPAVAQLFADVLSMPVTVTRTEEAAAWGAALCAGAAVGCFDRFDADPRELAELETVYRPDPATRARRADRYRVFQQVTEGLLPHWEAIEALSGDR
jgi:L-xylulokinase